MVTDNIKEEYKKQLDDSFELFADDRVTKIVEQVALFTVKYYNTLIENGVPAEHAATITAAYSSQIAALKP